MPDSPANADNLHRAIASLLAQRSVLGDAVVDAAVAALRDKLAAPSAAAAEGAEGAEPQLKQVSVLFTDVVGSTTLSQHLDPEDINAVMDGALARFTTLVQAHHGKVLQYAGDSVLAVFGSPVAHEDDAERAVLAGLAILDEGRAQGATVQARFGHDGFNVRVGIATGGVLLGGGVDGEHSIRGITVNIAARMEQTAPPGTLRISQDTWRQVRGRFELLEQPPLLVKGRDEPMVTYLVQGVRSVPDRNALRGVEGLRTRMVGRDAELAALQRAYAEAFGIARRGLRSITVVGDAGLGKSRLVAEFRAWVEAQSPQALWLQAFASEQHMNQPYGMLRGLLTSRSDLRDSDPPPQARDKWLAAAVPHLASRDDAAVLGHLLGFDFSAHPELRGLQGDARQLRDRAFFHASQLLRAWCGAGSPVVALIDDLHWTDDGTLDFIEHLVNRQADLPLLLLGPTRPALYERRSDWGRKGAGEQRIEIAPLAEAAAGELVDALLSRLAPVPERLRTLVAERADGNPFFIEELVNMLVDQRVIVEDGSAWRYLPERLQGLALPTTLVGVLQARLDALPTDERRTAQLASVVGFRFWDDSLVALGAPLPGGLQALVDHALTPPHEPSSLAGLREFEFKHHTLHQVSYDSVLRRIKKVLHAQVARWLVGLPGATPLDLVAEHFERGGETALALDYWQRAADAAADRYANLPALAHADRALALTAVDDLPRRHALTQLRVRVLELLSDRDRLAQAIDALDELATQSGDGAKQSDALVRRARYCKNGSEVAQALEWARKAVASAPTSIPASGTWARVLVVQCLSLMGRLAEAQAESAIALGLARTAGDKSAGAAILNEMGSMALDQGDYSTAIGLLDQALAQHRELGNRGNESGTLSNLGYAALMLGDYAAARAQFMQTRELFARIGHRQNEGATLINLGIALLNQNLPAEALSHARQAQQMLRAGGYRWVEGAALRLLGQASFALGDLSAAVEHLQASHELLQALGARHLALEPLAGLANVALARGERIAALQMVESILAAQAEGVALDGTEEPMRIRLICYQVLAAVEDARAPPLLAVAHRELIARAERISDGAKRQTYLHAVPYHRDIISAWHMIAAATAAP